MMPPPYWAGAGSLRKCVGDYQLVRNEFGVFRAEFFQKGLESLGGTRAMDAMV